MVWYAVVATWGSSVAVAVAMCATTAAAAAAGESIEIQ